MKNYNYNGFRPYGVGEMNIIDVYTISNKPVKELVNKGFTFIVKGEQARLYFPNNDRSILFVKEQ